MQSLIQNSSSVICIEIENFVPTEQYILTFISFADCTEKSIILTGELCRGCINFVIVLDDVFCLEIGQYSLVVKDESFVKRGQDQVMVYTDIENCFAEFVDECFGVYEDDVYESGIFECE